MMRLLLLFPDSERWRHADLGTWKSVALVPTTAGYSDDPLRCGRRMVEPALELALARDVVAG